MTDGSLLCIYRPDSPQLVAQNSAQVAFLLRNIQLEEALQYARQIVVWRLDCLGRNMQDLIDLVNNLKGQSIGFHRLQENLTMDCSNTTGQLMFHLFAAFAEFERNLIQEHSAEGRVAAKVRGRLGGLPEKYGDNDIEMMKFLIDGGTSIKDVAERCGVSRSTIYRYLEGK